MCGICGVLDFDCVKDNQEMIISMTLSLLHRGPDNYGTHAVAPISLGHTRLSIIDLSPTGGQPMISDDENWVLTYNGEIYNFMELRKELVNNGVFFRGRSDTEVVLRSFERWGTAALRRFKGMFALAIWNKEKQELYLARDLFGIKPLYYIQQSQSFIFASEIKSILASCRVDRKMNITALHEYLYYGTALGSDTMFEGIKKLLPGHYLTVGKGKFSILPFAALADTEEIKETVPIATEEVRNRLEHAIASHMVSDVPVGVFLSGGIDSSTITALASRHCPERLKTFSVGFDFAKGKNELSKAREVAEYFGTEHNELHIGAPNITETIEELVRCHDEPFGDAADIPLYLLCKQLKGSIKVVLQGDGGDEIFAGYRRYNILSFESAWRALAQVGNWAGPLLPLSPTSHRLRRFCQAMSQPDGSLRMALLLTEEALHLPPTRVLTKAARTYIEEFSPFRRYTEIHEQFKHLDPVQRMLFIDCHILLPDIFLEKVDKSTMAHGVEVRIPFLDRDLTRYVMGLPSTMKVRRGQKKWLIRHAMRGIVPDNILDAPKTGFSVPYGWWLKTSLADYLKSVLFDKQTLDWGIFDRDTMEICINEHIEGKRNNGFLLYKLLQIALWRKFYLNGS